MRTLVIFFMLCSLFCTRPLAWAESSEKEELQAMKVQLNAMQEKMKTYEQRIGELEGQLAAQPVPTQSGSTAVSAVPAKWIPEIGVVADTVVKLTSSKADAEGNNRLSLRELELVLGSNVDPFSRLDATISFSDEEAPSLEEAYLTRFGLPFGTTARLGKFKPKVGKALAIHRDSLDTVDEPLVIQRYFGTEGMSKSGVDLTKTLDLPLPVTQQLVAGVLEGGNGEDGTAFGISRRTPTVYAHLKNYMDLTKTTGLEVGFSPMVGSGGDEPSFDSQVLAADVTLTQKIGPIQTLKWQNEVFNLNRRKTTGADTDADGYTDVDFDGNLWGAYSLLDYRFHPQWSAGLRYDFVELVNNDPTVNPYDNDQGETGYVTFQQSEFARWRLQYSHARLATGKDDHTVYLQGTFAIGEHKHKIQ